MESGGATSFSRTLSAGGTHFADDPASITGNNGQSTLAASSLPSGSLSIYENTGQSAVAEIPFGAGKIIYLGWDWYDAVPIGVQDGGWLTVLESAVFELGPTPLRILTQPVSQTVKSGSNVTFTVVAQGAFPLVYHWQKDGTNLSNGGRISGATNATLSISTVLESDSGQYSVVITNSSESVTSSNATLLVTPLDHFEWSVISSPQAVGTPFGAIITAKDFLNATVTNFNATVNLSGSTSGAPATNTILAAPGSPFSNSGNFTLGYSFTPNTNMTVTHVRHYFGTKVSIWTDGGVLLAAQNVTSTPGTWSETALTTPIQLTAGVAYRVAAYAAGGSYYWRNDLGGTFPNGTINIAYEASGDAFPVNTDSVIWWFVDLRYVVNPGTPVALSPTSTGPFTNGVWSGMLTVLGPATNVVLRADEAGGHSGLSNPFNVLLQNDMSISMADSPDPVAVGANLTYGLTVANAGPSTATAVTVTNILPPNVAFVSATSSQGSCTQFAGVVTCNLGTMAGASNVNVSIVVVPMVAGVLTNAATVSRAEADPYLPNNTAIVATVAQVPAISISDSTLLEGNLGIANATFTVSLSIAGGLPISVNYATADGTALAGSDYVSTNATITFAPGQTNQTIVVAVKGDTTGEPDETFFVNLSGATNATVADAQGVGTILNDDVPPVAYVRSIVGSPWGTTVNETAMNRVFGTNNWQDLRYETLNPAVLLSGASTFIYLEGSDSDATELETFLTANMAVIQNWVSNGGSLFLNAAPNEDNGMDFGFGITLVYIDDTQNASAAVPAHRIFNGPFTPVGTSWGGTSFAHATVTGTGLTGLITNNVNAHIVLGEKGYGRGHVLFGGMTTDNFHTPQPQASNLRANIIAYLNALSAYHFEWSAISSPQQLNVPFPVTITARDFANGILNTFNGAVIFSALASASNAVSITPASSGNFTNGIWSGSITVQQPAPNVILSADDGSGHSGASSPFEVIATNDISLKLDDFPDPVSAGTNLTYTLTVSNTGPAAATSVMITNVLPANIAFVSAVASQGTCTQSVGTVSCALGTITGGTNATVRIIVVPTIAGASITNFASLTRGEADGYPGNNSVTEVTVVTTPAISIADAAIAEGDANTTNIVFGVTLAAPSAQAITVNYSTSDGTATAAGDYIGTNGSLTFPPGTTNLAVTVIVSGDKTIESNETFLVNLSNPVNGVLGRSQAVGTIINDDGLPGYLDHFAWNNIPSPQAAGVPFGASITAKDFFNATVTNFNGTVTLTGSAGGGSATNAILAAPSYTSSGSGNYTLGYSFTPNTNIVVTHVRHYFGTKVSIWTDGGVLLAAQNVTSTPGTWMETALPTPIQLSAGVTYRVAAYSGGGFYYYRTDLGTTFPNGAMNQAYEIFGDDFPVNSDSIQWWFVDLSYTVGSSVPATITPAVSGSFTNGTWNGNVTVQLLATNVVLLADDGGGHVGGSNPFDLVVQNDLSVSVSDLPNPVSVGANLTYTLSITNTGPTSATGVMLTNFLPANATFSSAAVSQGTYTQSGGVVICNLGTVPGATNASVSIVVVPAISGVVLTNRAVISRAEPESYLSNNIATTLTTVTLPAISVADASVLEGNVGTTIMVFAVTLAAPSAQTITANYATANGTAIAGSDYIATNGIVTFAPGITNQTVVVRLNGDTLIEGNETLFVNLSNPTNGVLGRSQGIGTITNDDGLPGQVDHFAWQPISSPQMTNVPFTTTITALDASNTLVTNFNGLVNLSAPQGTGVGTQTVQMLSYILYADTSTGGEYSQTLAAINNYFPNFVVTSTTTTDPATLQAQLAGKQVFLIVEQESAATGVLGPLGIAWSTVLNNFVNNGGIVIACSWNTEEHLILANSGLMDLTRFGAPSADTVSPGAGHFLNQGVSAPFAGSYIGWYSSANGTTVLQSSTNGYGVVLARDLGLGHVVMIGTDFFTLGTPMDRIVANAVRWAQGTASSAVPITPTVSGVFSNGTWTGSITVPSFATNVVLLADDSDGHIGLSNPFHVIGSNQPPIILTPPANALAYLGGTASFQVNVLGSDPMRYQWRANGADIAGATNATLMLARVMLNQAASYSVVVWNNYGTNSSAKATLTVQQVVAWGAGTNNTGLNFNYNQSVIPVGATNAVKAAGGLYHSLLLRADGKVLAWGAGTGASIVNPHYRQSIVPALGSAVDVAGGGYHSLALRGDGTLVAWGAGTNNTLSQPNYGQSIIPTAVSNTIAIAAGDYHSVALRNDGRVWVWGYNGFSQTNVPAAATSNVVAVASRGSHVLALKLDGSLVHWGSPSSLPAGVSNIVTIAAGVTHCLALKSDGTVVSWGSQTTVPAGLSNVVDIAAGSDHNLALRSDGSVVTWGLTNLYGRYKVPAGLSNFVGIACGNYHSLALLGDGFPLIKWQPISASALLGNPASLYVLAVGPQLACQWQLNGTNIPGATNSTFKIQSAQANDAGNYQAVLGNSFGVVTSVVASLTVLAPIGAAVDATNLTWSTSGNTAWFGQTSISHDGVDAAQSGHIIDGQQSTVQANVSGPGVLNFWWKVSSEQFFDYLNFYIDGAQQASVSGQVDWQFQTFAVGLGAHTVKWTYQKDSSVSAGLDAGWLDQVLYTTNPPVFTLQPLTQTNSMGANFSLNVSASGAPPITYQWLKGGVTVTGAVSSGFNFINATRRDSATYSVVASNPGGATLSSNAVVLIRVPQRLNAVMQPGGSLALTSGDADGGLLSVEDLGKFESQASSNLVDWVPLTNNVILTNGTLLLIDQNVTNYPARFYRIIEH